MTSSRIAGAAAAGIAAILALTGCIPLPSPTQPQSPQSPTTTQPQDPTTTQPQASEGDALVDTQWTGTVEGPELFIDLEFTFESDGTLYITRWSDETGVPFDVASDTWSVSGGTLSMTLSDIQEIQRIDLSGPVTGGSTLTLSGADGVGTSGYTVTFTQG